MKKNSAMLFFILTVFLSRLTLAQVEDDIVINEFVVNPSTGKEYIEFLVVADGINIQGWTISDVLSRTGSTSTTEGDVRVPVSASYLASVPRGTYVVIELITPAANTSTLSEDLTISFPTDRTLILKTSTSGVTTTGTMDLSTNENIQIYAGTRATGTIIDQVLCGTNSNSLISGATWGDNDVSTISDNINGGTALPSNCLIRFVPSDQSAPVGFQANDTGTNFIVDASSYGTPGTVNTGVDDSNGALPVELSSFSAIVLENAVKLNWRTETEVSNYGFEVERLQDYKNEKLQDWRKIGFVEGHGNSNSPKDYSFIDQNVSGGKYSYRLKQIDTDGQFEYSKVIEIDLDSPTKFELSQNYPNPFNPSTTISFSLPQSENVKLTVYNLLGEQVAELVNGFREAGVHTINFNAENFNSGLYIYKVEANGVVQSRKMTLVK